MLSSLSKFDENMTAGQFIKLIEKRGWRFEREGKGSHKIYKHPGFKDPISVPFHGKEDLGKGLLNKLKKQAGLK
jgi:predicted RNA binding protein YcfA (HicA-like mRNA interferase family)